MRRSATALVTALLVCVRAHAALITIDPNNYSNGSIIDPEGANLSFMYHEPLTEVRYDKAIAVTDPADATANVFGYYERGAQQYATNDLSSFPAAVAFTKFDSPGYEWSERTNWFAAMLVTFDNPTSYFAANLFSATGDVALWFAYGSDGTLIDSGFAAGSLTPECEWPGSSPCVTYEVTVTRDQADVAAIVYGSGDAAIGIDKISYQVPEPGTLSIVGIGLLGIIVGRRKLRQSCVSSY